MTRLREGLVLTMALLVLVVLPALAADPAVSRKVETDENGVTMVVLRVQAGSRPIYGMTVDEVSGSISNLYAPKGWVGISSGEHVLFRTLEAPIKSGKSASFKIVMPDTQAPLSLSFRDEKVFFGEKESR